MFWSRRIRERTSAARSIADQCDAFLSGRYRTILVERSRPVPAWAWLNPLAHGDDEMVAALARMPAWDDSPEACVARLARRTLLKMRDEHVSLAEVQHAVLIPLELALTARHGHSSPDDVTLGRAASRELARGLTPISVRTEPGR